MKIFDGAQQAAIIRRAFLLPVQSLSEPKIEPIDPHLGGGRLEGVMAAAIARAFARAFPANAGSIPTLEIIAIFCGLGLLASLVVASYGLDLSAGFF